LTNARGLRLFDADRDEDLDVLDLADLAPTLVHRNRHTQLAAPWLALTGRPYELRYSCRPGEADPGRFAIQVMGYALAAVPSACPPFGTFLLDPTALLDLQPWVPLDPATGEGTYAFVVPGTPALLGQFFAVQGLLVDPNGTASHLSNVVHDIVRQ
jgi:hypothetical protein